MSMLFFAPAILREGVPRIAGNRAIRAIITTFFFILAIHLTFIGFWIFNAYGWHELLYGDTYQFDHSRWDFFHFLYWYGPGFIALFGFWELVPLTHFFLSRKRLVNAMVTIERKPFLVGWQMGGLAIVLLLVLVFLRMTDTKNVNDLQLITQVLLCLFWGKYTSATSWFTGWKL